MNPPSLDNESIGNILKVVQIAFYSVGIVLAALIYRAAKKGLLNTVRTEYQKRVMDRLAKLSEDLYSEFDSSSPYYWANKKPTHKAIEEINDGFIHSAAEILEGGFWPYDTPFPDSQIILRSVLSNIKSDPFIPDEIRIVVVDFIENRQRTEGSIYLNEFDKYIQRLVKGKQRPIQNLDEINKIHNRIVLKLRERGYGIDHIEAEVHNIRGLIQTYFEAFNPQQSWWQRKRLIASNVEDLP